MTFNCSDPLGQPVPAYNLDTLKLGQIVSLITENRPVSGLAANSGGPNSNGTNANGTIPAISTCIGIRTTFQVMVGTCKIWKVRKYFNTCSSLTTGNTGANPVNADPKRYQPSAAGSVFGFDPWFSDEQLSCLLVVPPIVPANANRFTSAQVSRFPDDWLELFLSWYPGGVTLQPYGSKAGGFEKVVTYFLDIE